MIQPDVNLLVYAHDTTSEFHEKAAAWLEQVLDNEQVFFSWHSICGFLRIVTNKRIYLSPMSLRQAIATVENWLDLDNTHLISLEKKNWPLFAKALTDGQATGNLVMDAHLAAMAASCGAKLASTDRDFTRFPGIQLVDPIKS
jgi:toxin-antitoxin system PIN domain toxin